MVLAALGRHLLPDGLHADSTVIQKLKTAAQRRLTAALYDHMLDEVRPLILGC
jgi:hypothetical protein